MFLHLAFRDLLLNVILSLVLIIGSLQVAKKVEETSSQKPIAQISASIAWPQGDIDVDLWLNGPEQDRATGYSNKSGITWDLVRDDLGNVADRFPLNFENGFVRNFAPGEYTINIHYYRDRAHHGPVTVAVELMIEINGRRKVIDKQLTLNAVGEELTAINFKIDDKGNVTDVNSVYVPLRAASVEAVRPVFAEGERQ